MEQIEAVNFSIAGEALNLTRQRIYQMARKGDLKWIESPTGQKMVPICDLIDLAKERNEANSRLLHVMSKHFGTAGLHAVNMGELLHLVTSPAAESAGRELVDVLTEAARRERFSVVLCPDAFSAGCAYTAAAFSGFHSVWDLRVHPEAIATVMRLAASHEVNLGITVIIKSAHTSTSEFAELWCSRFAFWPQPAAHLPWLELLPGVFLVSAPLIKNHFDQLLRHARREYSYRSFKKREKAHVS